MHAVSKTPKTTHFKFKQKFNQSTDSLLLYLPRVEKVAFNGCYALKKVEKCLEVHPSGIQDKSTIHLFFSY